MLNYVLHHAMQNYLHFGDTLTVKRSGRSQWIANRQCACLLVAAVLLCIVLISKIALLLLIVSPVCLCVPVFDAPVRRKYTAATITIQKEVACKLP